MVVMSSLLNKKAPGYMLYYQIKETNIQWPLNQSKASPHKALEQKCEHRYELKQGIWSGMT